MKSVEDDEMEWNEMPFICTTVYSSKQRSIATKKSGSRDLEDVQIARTFNIIAKHAMKWAEMVGILGHTVNRMQFSKSSVDGSKNMREFERIS